MDGESKLMHAPVDLEGHKGTVCTSDRTNPEYKLNKIVGRKILFSRFFAYFASRNTKSKVCLQHYAISVICLIIYQHFRFPVSYLYRLLRPEFLQSYNRPLSPDAFSVFSRSQPDFTLVSQRERRRREKEKEGERNRKREERRELY